MFNKKKIAIGVAMGVVGLTGIIGSAYAVHVNPEGTGQFLIFPYFNAQNGYVTNINLLNSTDQTKAVRIRFNEGKTSKDVLDFNIYMSPEDVWTGSIRATDKGGALVGSVSTSDRTCTLPEGASCADNKCNVTVPFSGTDIYSDVAPEDTLEGYIEVIEMGVVTDTTVQNGVLHTKGKPNNCVAVTDAWYRKKFVTGQGNAKVNDGAITGLSKPTGGLFGSSAVLNIERGVAMSIDPVAIENYTNVAYHTRPDDANNFELPSLASGDVSTSEVMLSGSDPQLVKTTWKTLDKDPCLNDADPATPACGRNPYPLAHALLARSVMNEYFLDPTKGYDGHTDWVVTFPMKKLGIFNRTASEQLTKVDILNANKKPTGKFNCEDEAGNVYTPEEIGNAECIRYGDVRVAFGEDIFDREEGRIKDANFSPVVAKPPRILEKEVNVLTFTSNDVAYDATRTVLAANHSSKDKGEDPNDFVSTGAFVHGWSRMKVADDYRLSTWWPKTEDGRKETPYESASIASFTADHGIYKGVPTLGFAAIEGNVSESPNTRFGDALPHKMERDHSLGK